MKNFILGLALFFLYSLNCGAQSNDECERSLQYASTFYSQGNYRACIRTLNEKCFYRTYLDTDEKIKKSFKIKIESLKAIDFDFEADELYKKFERWIINKRTPAYTTSEIRKIYKRIPTS